MKEEKNRIWLVFVFGILFGIGFTLWVTLMLNIEPIIESECLELQQGDVCLKSEHSYTATGGITFIRCERYERLIGSDWKKGECKEYVAFETMITKPCCKKVDRANIKEIK